jgi:hypothetical protein
MKNPLLQVLQYHSRRIVAAQPALLRAGLSDLDTVARQHAAQAHCRHVELLLEPVSVFVQRNLGRNPETASDIEIIASTDGIGGWVHGAFGYADSCLELSANYLAPQPGKPSAESSPLAESGKQLLVTAAGVTYLQALMLFICASRLEFLAGRRPQESAPPTTVQLTGWIDKVEPQLSALASRLAEGQIDVDRLASDACQLAATCQELVNIWTKYVGSSLNGADLKEAARAFTVAANILVSKMTLLLLQSGEEPTGA